MSTPLFFATPAAFRDWLAEHHATASELLVGYYKVGSGRPSMTWSESVDEALCFGWIDGVRRRVDDTAYTIRFTPRRPTSIWSAVNLAKIEVLTAAGRMQPAGMRAFEARQPARQAVYAFEQSTPAAFDREQEAVFREATDAWAFFAATPPSYRRTVTHWVVSAKQPATRARRLAQLIEACRAGRRLR
ncbi:MAG TPA: YdeI/OmpD-associated family protein [Gemmatimonadaceae bacterium]|nr:YdeI/OmpD-associated family protein [Gemmatimonadaceae bacterium]